MVQGGSLRPEFAAAWAQYIAKFVNAYEQAGIPIWGLTVQNEPLARQTWESMIFSAEQERDFLRDHLGPTLARAGLGSRKLIVWDHNRDLIKHRADVILSDPEAAKYVWGVGFHWYETWDGSPPMHASVAATKQGWPGIQVLLTEATVEGFDPARVQSWPNAERYGRQIIGDFNAGAVGWTDWNILLDERGGPNHVGNFCFAPVHADTATGALTFTPTFAYLGHFSKFIRPGARRVSAVSSLTSRSITKDAVQIQGWSPHIDHLADHRVWSHRCEIVNDIVTLQRAEVVSRDIMVDELTPVCISGRDSLRIAFVRALACHQLPQCFEAFPD